MPKANLIISQLISFLLLIHLQQADPFITEFIIPFDLPINDFKTAATNQISRNEFHTSTFTTDNITVSQLIYKTSYNGTNRIVDPPQVIMLFRTESPFHTVWNDSIDLTITYQAVLHKLPTTKKTFNGTTKVKVYVNYTKRLVPELDSTEITGLDVKVDKASFQMSYTGNPNSNEKAKLDEINNGVVSGKKNTTILMLLEKQEFTNALILSFFKENLSDQKISPTYNSSYVYMFDKVKAEFDMTTAGVDTITHGIAHYLNAKIKDYREEAEQLSVMPYVQGYHTLFSLDFVNYFLQYNLKTNPSWVSFKINQNTYNTTVFKFKLISLEYLFEKLVKDYSEYYLNDISITCSPKNYEDLTLIEETNDISVKINWSCKGYLSGPTPAALILDFEASLTYIAEVRLSSSITVYIPKTTLNSLQFQVIDDSPLSDPEIASIYAQEVVDYLRGYTVGTYFTIKSNSTKVLFKEDVGIYIG